MGVTLYDGLRLSEQNNNRVRCRYIPIVCKYTLLSFTVSEGQVDSPLKQSLIIDNNLARLYFFTHLK
jgi:hypothetical protein